MVYCPECESDLDLEAGEMEEGEVVSCAECGTDFEVLTVEPLELRPVDSDSDDDDDDEEDEEEEDDDDAGAKAGKNSARDDDDE